MKAAHLFLFFVSIPCAYHFTSFTWSSLDECELIARFCSSYCNVKKMTLENEYQAPVMNFATCNQLPLLT